MHINTFIDHIAGVQGIVHSGTKYDERTNSHIQIFRSMKGHIVLIDTSEEDIDDEDCLVYLKQLGIESHFIFLFPEYINGKS